MTDTTTQALEPCPFCNCAMHVHSNRDWHRPRGEHVEDCILLDNEPMFPATDEGLADLLAAWNKRALSPAADAARATDMLTPLEKIPGYTDPLIFGQYSVRDFHSAPSGEGPKAFEWKDKPHRLVYDLCRALLSLASQGKDEDEDEDAYLIDRLSKLLAGVAVALKGEELPRHRHSYHDLPEVAQTLVLERDLLKSQLEELRAAPPAQEAGALSDDSEAQGGKK